METPIKPRHSRVVTRDGVGLAVTENGPRDAEHTVVLMHGLCLDRSSWKRHAEALSSLWGSDVRVISYDHRGHGTSGQAHLSTYTIDTLASDLADVLAWAKVPGSLTLAGHSMGGMTALAYMGRLRDDRPVDPSSLLLVATAAGSLTSRGVGALLSLPVIPWLSHADRIPARVGDPMSRWLTGALVNASVRHIGYPARRDRVSATAAAWSINRTPLRTKAGFLNALRTFDARDVLPTVWADTLVLSGGMDLLTPKEHAEDIAAGIPGAEHQHYPNVGHMIMDEAHDEVAAALDLMTHLAVRPMRSSAAAG